MKIKITELDRLFSRYVRLRSGGYCKRCQKCFGFQKLHNAHFHSRRKHSVRWDIRNTAPLCYGCHSYIDGNPLIKVEFFMEILGREQFNTLNALAQQLGKVDKEALKEEFKNKIRLLED